jgi:tRNA splicing ligase
VSYAWELADRAREQLRAMETWLQEQTLDVIDSIAISPAPVEHPRRLDEFVQDFVRERGGIRHYVFLTLSLDEARNQFHFYHAVRV